MIISEIRYNQAIQRLRLDAEFYLPSKLESIRTLNAITNHTIGEYFDSIGDMFNPNKYDQKNETVNIVELADISNKFVSNKRTCKIYEVGSQKKKFESGDVLISRLRSYLEEIFYAMDFPENQLNLCSTEFIVLRSKEKEKIISEFLYVFLQTSFIQEILKWSQDGTNHPRFGEDYLLSLPLPIPPPSFQQRIESYVKESYQKRKSADEKYKQAQELLNKILGIEKLELREEKVFETRFDEVKATLRFDAEHYQPKYKQVKVFLNRSGYEVKKLREIVKISNKKIEPSKEPTKLFNYIELADINPSTGEIEGVSQIKGNEAPSRARMLVKKGDVLISSILGSLDNIGLVFEEFDNAVASTGFFVIRSKSFSPEFLFLLFKSNLMRLQLEEKIAGAIMSAVPKTTFGDLLIPIVSEQIQNQISDLVKQSFLLRKESKELLEKAKREVEEFIENRESKTPLPSNFD
jgi:restriction endonuclease S subunit